MHCRKALHTALAPPMCVYSVPHRTYQSHSFVKWKASHSEDFADLDDYVAEQEQLEFSVNPLKRVLIDFQPSAYLRPTAACFLSDRNIKYAVMMMAKKAMSIDPVLGQSVIPRATH